MEYIEKIINESNFISLFEDYKNEKNGFHSSLYNLQKECLSLFNAIADEIKDTIGRNCDGYEIENFSTSVGNGQSSFYMNIDNGSYCFEIRLSDHDDKHFYGNRRCFCFNEKNVKENILTVLKEEIKNITK